MALTSALARLLVENLAGSQPGADSYQHDGYELVDKSSLRIGMMGDCRAFMLIKFTKSALCAVIPCIKQINI